MAGSGDQTLSEGEGKSSTPRIPPCRFQALCSLLGALPHSIPLTLALLSPENGSSPTQALPAHPIHPGHGSEAQYPGPQQDGLRLGGRRCSPSLCEEERHLASSSRREPLAAPPPRGLGGRDQPQEQSAGILLLSSSLSKMGW